MNRKVISILILIVVALVILYLYSFGPLASSRITQKINPRSEVSTKTDINVNNQKLSFNSYHNKDLKENYYGIVIPSDWQMGKSTTPGSYQFSWANGTAQIALQDVSDNTSLELYILSQAEPQIKKGVANYKRVDYQKLTINGSASFQIVYSSTDQKGQSLITEKTYISGTDHAGVITFNLLGSNFAKDKSILDSIVNSFKWENQ